MAPSAAPRGTQAAGRPGLFRLLGFGGLLLSTSLGVAGVRAAEIQATGGAQGLGSRVNGTVGGSCVSGACAISGGTAAGSNLFHRFSAFDTRGGITGVSIDGQGFRHVMVGVTNPLGTFLDKPLSLSGGGQLVWLSPAGIHLSGAAGFTGVAQLSLSTATSLRIGDGLFDALRSTAAQAGALRGSPMVGPGGLFSDPAALQSAGLSRNGDLTLQGGLLTVDHSLLLDAQGGHVLLQGGRIEAPAITVQGQAVAQATPLSASGGQGGSVSLEAAGNLLASAPISASGATGVGGSISLRSGAALIQTAGSHLDVSGEAGGGSIAVSGGTSLFSSGGYDARGRADAALGGRVELTAPAVVLRSAEADAGGGAGGGAVRVGGGWQGAPLTSGGATARSVDLDAGTSLAADARTRGDGGQVVVWSDATTRFAGSVSARAGRDGGNGGAIEVSGKGLLRFAGAADAAAPAGAAGQLLLDPETITIDANAGGGGGGGGAPTGYGLTTTTLEDSVSNPSSSLSDGQLFARDVVLLANGTVVATNPGSDFFGIDSGAVYHFSLSGELLSMLHGSISNDRVGSGGITALNNGNYVVSSPSWRDVASEGIPVGAATWRDGSPSNFSSEAVSSANSLLGSSFNDAVSSGGVKALSNGNFVVVSPAWNLTDASGSITSIRAGAVTWGNGTTGGYGPNGLAFGAVSESNSLIGSTAGDAVGSGGVTVLSNGNFVVSSPDWSAIGLDASTGTLVALPGAGAVTLGDGSDGRYGPLQFKGTGPINANNSLIGVQVGDGVGSGGVTALTGGNYVISSPDWGGQLGAATWGSGIDGVQGVIDGDVNSLVGSTPGDRVSSGGVTPLSNGHFVVSSPDWASRTFSFTGDSPTLIITPSVGAVTWGDGGTGRYGLAGELGVISAVNSLIGTVSGDAVGSGGVTALNNGAYVVSSPDWRGAGANVEVGGLGAATWGDGLGGVQGEVDAVNSLIGGSFGDRVSSGGITALTNGSYVVSSPSWTFETVTFDGFTSIVTTNLNAGAATWGDINGISGQVDATNSLIGASTGDRVSSGGITALTNGNYVVSSPEWSDTANGLTQVGAATWGSGSTGLTAFVNESNSLIGSFSNDRVSSGGITALSNGNYVVVSPDWSPSFGGSEVPLALGAVTWSWGQASIGRVNGGNSLTGGSPGDAVGSGGVTALANGNFVVSSPSWQALGPDAQGNASILANAGAATWGDGTLGTYGPTANTTGPVNASNSLVGINANDRVSSGGIVPLANGNFVVSSPQASSLITDANGTTLLAEAGAVSFGYAGFRGGLSSSNSIFGSSTGDRYGETLANSKTSSIIDLSAHLNDAFLVNSNFFDGNAGASIDSGLLQVVRATPLNPGGAEGLLPGDGIITAAFDYLGQDITIRPADIVAIASKGTSVLLQASADIILAPSSDIDLRSEVPQTTGDITFQAGRSILLNSSIFTAGSSLTFTANDSSVQSGLGAPGVARLEMTPDTSLDTSSSLNGRVGDITLRVTADSLFNTPGLLKLDGALLKGGAIDLTGNGGVLVAASSLQASSNLSIEGSAFSGFTQTPGLTSIGIDIQGGLLQSTGAGVSLVGSGGVTSDQFGTSVGVRINNATVNAVNLLSIDGSSGDAVASSPSSFAALLGVEILASTFSLSTVQVPDVIPTISIDGNGGDLLSPLPINEGGGGVIIGGDLGGGGDGIGGGGVIVANDPVVPVAGTINSTGLRIGDGSRVLFLDASGSAGALLTLSGSGGSSSAPDGSGSLHSGIQIDGGTEINGAEASLSITATGGTATNGRVDGLRMLSSTDLIPTSIASGAGGISITATAGSSANGQGIGALIGEPVQAGSGARIATSGGGSIAITASGNAGSSITSAGNSGLVLAAQGSLSGSGPITLQGTAGQNGTDANIGVLIAGNLEASDTVGAGIGVSIIGTGGGSGSNNSGVSITSGAELTGLDASTRISIAGTGSSSPSASGAFNHGIHLAGSIASAGGLQLSGFGGSGLDDNRGFQQDAGSTLSVSGLLPPGQSESSAGLSLLLQGSASISGASGRFNSGVLLSGSTTVSGGGRTSIFGAGAESGTDNNVGVAFGNPQDGVTFSTDGFLAINGLGGGTSGAGSGSFNHGLVLDQGQITSAGLRIDADGGGRGSGNGNSGIRLAGFISGSAGASLQGRGGSGVDFNRGIQQDAGAQINISGAIPEGIDGAGQTLFMQGRAGFTATGQDNVGLSLAGFNTVNGGDATLIGVGSPTGTDRNVGIILGNLQSGGSLFSAVDGFVAMEGIGQGSGSDNHGVLIGPGQFRVRGLEIDGLGSAGSTGGSNTGVRLVGGFTSFAGADLRGVAGSGSNQNRGIQQDTGSLVTISGALPAGSANSGAALVLEGLPSQPNATSTGALGSDNIGVDMAGSIAITGGAPALIEGTGGNGSNNNVGVRLGASGEGTAISSLTTDGSLSIQGTGAGSGSGNRGLVTSRLSLSAAGLDLNGRGSTTASGEANVGIELGGSISSSQGFSAYGRGGSGSGGNSGFSQPGGALLTVSGTLPLAAGNNAGRSLVLVGDGGSGVTGSFNSGVILAGTTTISGGGPAEVFGSALGGVDSNVGLVFGAPDTPFSFSSDGFLSLDGISDGSGSFNSGLSIGAGQLSAGGLSLSGSGSTASTGQANHGVLLGGGITSSGGVSIRADGGQGSGGSRGLLQAQGSSLTVQGALPVDSERGFNGRALDITASSGDSSGSNNRAVDLEGTTTITSSAPSSIVGIVSNGGLDANIGIALGHDSHSAGVTSAGSLSFQGVASGSGSGNIGFYSTGRLASSGLDIIGTGGSGTSDNFGVYQDGPYSQGGSPGVSIWEVVSGPSGTALSVNGFANGSGNRNIGVLLEGSTSIRPSPISPFSTGLTSITGRGGAGVDGNSGVVIGGLINTTNPAGIQSGGAVNITGIRGDASGSDNVGIDIRTALSSTAANPANGLAFSLAGSGPTSPARTPINNNIGIRLQSGASLSASGTDGGIALEGSGAGSGTSNHGIVISNGFDASGNPIGGLFTSGADAGLSLLASAPNPVAGNQALILDAANVSALSGDLDLTSSSGAITMVSGLMLVNAPYSLSVSGAPFTWQGGRIQGSGAIRAPLGVILNGTGASIPRVFDLPSWTLTGATLETGSLRLAAGRSLSLDGSGFTAASGSSLLLDGGASLTSSTTTSIGGQLDLAPSASLSVSGGSFTTTGSSDITLAGVFSLSPSAAVDLGGGSFTAASTSSILIPSGATLTSGGSTSIAGLLDVSPNATLSISGGSFSTTSGSTTSLAGLLDVDPGATVNVLGTFNAANGSSLLLASGASFSSGGSTSLAGQLAISPGATLAVTGGSFGTTGTSSTSLAGTLQVSGDGAVALAGGSFTSTSGSSLLLGSGASLTSAATTSIGGGLDLSPGATLAVTGGSFGTTGTSSTSLAGTLQVAPGLALSLGGGSFTSTSGSALLLGSGASLISAASTSIGGQLEVGPSASVTISGGSFGTTGSSTLQLLSGATFTSGVNTGIGGLLTLSPTASLTMTGGRFTTLTGSTTNLAGVFSLGSGSTASLAGGAFNAASGSSLLLAGGSSLTSAASTSIGGLLEVSPSASLAITGGNFTAAGTSTVQLLGGSSLSSAASTSLAGQFDVGAGATVAITEGTLALSGRGIDAGAIYTIDGADSRLLWSGGTRTISGGSTYSSTSRGTYQLDGATLTTSTPLLFAGDLNLSSGLLVGTPVTEAGGTTIPTLTTTGAYRQSGGSIRGFASIDITTPAALTITGGSIVTTPGGALALQSDSGFSSDLVSIANATLDTTSTVGSGGSLKIDGPAIRLTNTTLITSGSTTGGSIRIGMAPNAQTDLSQPFNIAIVGADLVADPAGTGGEIAINGQNISVSGSNLNVLGGTGGSLTLGSTSTSSLTLDSGTLITAHVTAPLTLEVAPEGTLVDSARRNIIGVLDPVEPQLPLDPVVVPILQETVSQPPLSTNPSTAIQAQKPPAPLLASTGTAPTGGGDSDLSVTLNQTSMSTDPTAATNPTAGGSGDGGSDTGDGTGTPGPDLGATAGSAVTSLDADAARATFQAGNAEIQQETARQLGLEDQEQVAPPSVEQLQAFLERISQWMRSRTGKPGS